MARTIVTPLRRVPLRRAAAAPATFALLALAPIVGGCVSESGSTTTTATGSSSASGTGSTGGAGGTGGSVGTGGAGGGCAPGATRTCYTGPAGTEGVGICHAGVQGCDDHGSFSGPCAGEVLPEPETCLTPVDDNCNGLVNEGGAGCVCTPSSMTSCYTGPDGTEGVGICTAGVQTCDAEGLSYGPCVGEVLPQPENCFDLVDDDCNGETNEDGAGCVCTPNEVVACYTGPAGTLGVGACIAGTWACNAQGTEYGPCNGEVTPVPETCLTPIDDNCNGLVNEGGVGCVCLPNSMSSCYDGPPGTLGVGICVGGTSTCNDQGTANGPCVGEILPQVENCFNQLDDNCNGVVNEGCTCVPGQAVSCYDGPPGTLGVGICAAGTSTCNAQMIYGPCMGEVLPQPENCFDDLDDNCNGLVNEGGPGCVCLPGSTASCYDGPPGTLGVGICAAGTYTCNMLGTAYGPCMGEVLPQPENCFDDLDDNCNGLVNEGGPGCVCTPDAMVSCYDGPPGTAGVGICKSGLGECNALGTVVGVCVGEVLPQAENCATPADENCDGMSPPCTGAYEWAYSFGNTHDDEGISVTVDPSGNVLLGGYIGGAVNFGCGTITGNALGSATVVKMTPAGNCIWSEEWGSYSEVNGIASDAVGDVFVTGPYTQPVDFGGGPLSFAGGSDVFIAKFDTNGQYKWAKGYGDSASQDSSALVVDNAGNVLSIGYFAGTMNFGGQNLVSMGGDDIYVVKLDSAGNHVWSQRFGDSSGQLSSDIATDGAGNVFVAGAFNGSIAFANPPTVACPNMVSAGLGDGFLAKLSPAGACLWSKQYGDADNQIVASVAADAAGDVVFGLNFNGTVNVGCGPTTETNGFDMIVAKVSSVDGSCVWQQFIEGPNNQTVTKVTLDPFGNVVVTGILSGSADFSGNGKGNGVVLMSAGSGDIFLAKYDVNGGYLWAENFGDAGSQNAKWAATDATGAIYACGNLVGDADFGGGLLPLHGGEDIYIAKFAP